MEPRHDWRTLITLCGSMVLLCGVAVFFSNLEVMGAVSSGAQSASLSCTFLGEGCPGPPGSPAIESFTIATPFAYGATTTLSWKVSGVGDGCWVAGGQFGDGYPCGSSFCSSDGGTEGNFPSEGWSPLTGNIHDNYSYTDSVQLDPIEGESPMYYIGCLNIANYTASYPSFAETQASSCPQGDVVEAGECVPPGIPAPTLSITGNGQNPVSVMVGQPVTVAATFDAGTGDTLEQTAINDNNQNEWCGTGNTCDASMWTASPLNAKSYTFTPTEAGAYVFYPAVQTSYYPLWNNYNQSLIVTATVSTCSNGLDETQYPSCSCPAGEVQQGSSCVVEKQTSCSNGLDISQYPSCTCELGFHQSGSACVQDPPAIISNPALGISCSAGSAPATSCRVQKGNPVYLTWSTNAMHSCVVTNGAGTTLLSGISATNEATPAVSASDTYTLTCLDANNTAYQASVSVTLIPAFEEI